MSELLPKLTGLAGTVFSTPFFFLFFVGVVWWVYRKNRKSLYHEISMLPIEDEPSTSNGTLSESGGTHGK